MGYSLEEKKELLKIAREAIENYFKDGIKRYPLEVSESLKEERGVFVTLHVNGMLNGCIGYPLPFKPLYQAVVDNALAAAFEDYRFPPLKEEDLPFTDIEISVLTVPVPVSSPSEVKVGKHGIIITKGYKRGLLLPQVPLEYGWSLEEYLSHGCLKAGLPSDEWKKGVQIEVFEAEVFSEKELKNV